MRAVVQRVSSAKVTVQGRTAGCIAGGLLVLVGVGREDTARDAAYLAGKTAGLRVFEGSDGRMTKSVGETGGSILAIPQFTLFGDVRRGLRPSFDAAAEPATAERLYEEYLARLRAEGLEVATGVFRSTMRVESVNEGPVTILLDSSKPL